MHTSFIVHSLLSFVFVQCEGNFNMRVAVLWNKAYKPNGLRHQVG